MMNFNHIWTISKKDIGILIRKKYTLYVTLILPLILSIGLPLILKYSLTKSGASIDKLAPIIIAFSFLFVLIAAVIPMTLATYSFVGEKVEKSLEPLLATPISDSELLFGKILAAVIPCICMLFACGGIYIGIMSAVIGYANFPQAFFYIILFLTVPLAAFFSVEFCVIISSRVSDIRSAQLLSSIVLIPILAIYILTETSVFPLNTTSLLIIAGVFGLCDIILFFFNKSLFQREEILTRWK